ncbi:hypothetical protein L7F22_033478, partial [Adiantum nelumboides]|nr:hypothetical protein [Adiantum nelumboides]
AALPSLCIKGTGPTRAQRLILEASPPPVAATPHHHHGLALSLTQSPSKSSMGRLDQALYLAIHHPRTPQGSHWPFLSAPWQPPLCSYCLAH